MNLPHKRVEQLKQALRDAVYLINDDDSEETERLLDIADMDRANGVPPRFVTRLIQNGCSVMEISAQTELSENTIRRWMQNNNLTLRK